MATFRVPTLDRFPWQQSVKDKDTLAPPGSPTKGDRYIINGAGTGAWATHDLSIVYYDGAAWVFDTPAEGALVWVSDENELYRFTGTMWHKENAGIYARDYGAVGDGTTDDTAAIQAAVTACLATTPASPLYITGRHRLVAHVHIDRQIDTQDADFRIIGLGASSGFYKDAISGGGAVAEMFSSTYTNALGPVSEFITFENIYFEGSSASLGAYVLDGIKFLRIKFRNCRFQKMRLLTSSIYVQTVSLNGCSVRAVAGVFFNSDGGTYDISFGGACIIENIETLFRSKDAVNGNSGFRFTDSVCELTTKSAIIATGMIGSKISGLYTEVTGIGTASPAIGTDPFMDLSSGTGCTIHIVSVDGAGAITDGHIEAGGSGYRVGDAIIIDGGTTSARFVVATVSGDAVATITLTNGLGYSPAIVATHALVNQGISFTGNFLNQTDPYQVGVIGSVKWGHSTQVTSSGNFCNGWLHDCSQMTASEWAGFSSFGEVRGTNIPPPGNICVKIGNAIFGGQINLTSLPTSSAGLAVGDLYNDSGTVKIKL